MKYEADTEPFLPKKCLRQAPSSLPFEPVSTQKEFHRKFSQKKNIFIIFLLIDHLLNRKIYDSLELAQRVLHRYISTLSYENENNMSRQYFGQLL